MKLKKLKNLGRKSGFALVEVLVAVSLLSATIITISALTISMMRANSLNHNHLVATELAREGLEITRNIRDTNWKYYRHWLTDIHDGADSPYTFSVDSQGLSGNVWNVFVPASDDDSLLYKNDNLLGYTEYTHSGDSADATPYHRTVTVTPVMDNSDDLDASLPAEYVLKVLVESKVWWNYRGQDKEITLYTELTDWNN